MRQSCRDLIVQSVLKSSMFIAMNRFKIVLGKEQEFEKVWRERDTHLNSVEGFKEFHLIKGDTNKEFSCSYMEPSIKSYDFCGLLCPV